MVWERFQKGCPSLAYTQPSLLLFLMAHVIRSHAQVIKLGRIAYNVTDIIAAYVRLKDSKSPHSLNLFS